MREQFRSDREERETWEIDARGYDYLDNACGSPRDWHMYTQ
jgi:hypothetical protein